MKTRLSRLLTLMMTVAVLSAIQPRIVSAQTSGVGPDGFTRIMWRGTDDSILLWKLNASLLRVAEVRYGNPGYDPIAIAVGSNNNTYVLWAHANGSISLWRLDQNLNEVTRGVSGPEVGDGGWRAQGLSSGGGKLRVIWRQTGGALAVWAVNPTNLAFLADEVHTTAFGFDPGAP